MNGDSANGQWISLRDLPERLGCSADEAQHRTLKGRWKQRTTSEGRRFVLVPGRELMSPGESGVPLSTALPPSASPSSHAALLPGSEAKPGDEAATLERTPLPERGTVYATLVEELRRRAETAEARAQAAEQRAERIKRLLDQARLDVDASKQQQRTESKNLRLDLQRERDARAIAETRLAAVEEEAQFLRQLVIDFSKSTRHERRWRLFGSS